MRFLVRCHGGGWPAGRFQVSAVPWTKSIGGAGLANQRPGSGHSAPARTTAAATAGARPGTSAAAGPSAQPAGSPRSAATTPGPLLSSQSYAQYAFQVWPGRLSPAGQAAETGLAITVRRRGNGLEVSAGVSGQPASSPQFYLAGARVYVIEASLGDDSGTSDYNLGDDGIVITDTHGRIVR